MGIEKLIERLRTESLYADKASLEIMDLCMDAATALSTLQAENEKLRAELERVKLVRCKDCKMSRPGGLGYISPAKILTREKQLVSQYGTVVVIDYESMEKYFLKCFVFCLLSHRIRFILCWTL